MSLVKPIDPILCILNRMPVDVGQIDANSLLQAGEKHRINGQIYLEINNTYSHANNILEPFKKWCRYNQCKAIRQATASIALNEVAKINQKPILFLKGICLSKIIYNDIGVRSAKDIDILVKACDLLWFDQLLKDLGYVLLSNYYPFEKIPKKYLGIILKQWCEITYYHPETMIQIDLHWKFDSDNLFKIDYDALLESGNAEQIEINNNSLPTLPEPLNFFYTCFHAEKHFCERLHWLYDTFRYAQLKKNSDFDLLFDTAKKYTIEKHFYYLCQRWKTHFPSGSQHIAIPTFKHSFFYSTPTIENQITADSTVRLKQFLKRKLAEFSLVNGLKNKCRYLFRFVARKPSSWIIKYNLPSAAIYPASIIGILYLSCQSCLRAFLHCSNKCAFYFFQ